MTIPTDQQQQYQEEIDLVVSFGMVSPDDQLRDDQPQKTIQLTETREAKARLEAELKTLASRERLLVAELLPDDERKRVAQLVRDWQAGTLPGIDDDVPTTPCPKWCESDRCENGHGKYHEGAVTTVPGVNWQGGMSPDAKSADVYVCLDSETGRPVLTIHADCDLDYSGAMDLATGLIRAAGLWRFGLGGGE